jgi:hypothetical protein
LVTMDCLVHISSIGSKSFFAFSSDLLLGRSCVVGDHSGAAR